MTTTRAAAVAGCCSSSSSSVVAGRGGRGRGAAVAAFADNDRGIKPARVPRMHALSRPHLHVVDARRSHCLLETTKQGFKRSRNAPIRAAIDDGKGDDSTLMPSTSTSEPSSQTSQQQQQQQQDLDVLRRAQARDTGTTYPLEETRVSKRDSKRVKNEWIDQSDFFSFFQPRPNKPPQKKLS